METNLVTKNELNFIGSKFLEYTKAQDFNEEVDKIDSLLNKLETDYYPK
jgi:hypothetical protein